MGPFSLTGQPNAMGGRETGGLANMLAAHMEIDNAEHRRIVQGFWDSPRLANKPGLKAVDLFRAVGDGRIKALWIMATNPVDSMPQADVVRAAIESCPFVVVSDVARHTDTTALAHVLLPSAAWGEKSGTVTNSERRISRQRTFLKAPGEARPDWWQLAEIGRRMGWHDAFDYAGPAAIFAEYARMTGTGNGGKRDLDISACGDISESDYDSLAPFRFPNRLRHLPHRGTDAGEVGRERHQHDLVAQPLQQVDSRRRGVGAGQHQIGIEAQHFLGCAADEAQSLGPAGDRGNVPIGG
jgi:assimilatory nitrate reductase catalytic subunit